MKQRKSEGGAYCVRGTWFLRVTVAPGQRQAEAMPWCVGPCTCVPVAGAHTCEPGRAAQERARATQALVNDLRAAGETTWIAGVVEKGAAGDEAILASLGRNVERIVAGKLPPAMLAPPGATRANTFRDVVRRWTAGELARDYPDHVAHKRSRRNDVYRAKHVPDEVQDLPLAAWTVDTYEGVMRGLPPKLGSASRRQIAQFMHRVCELAVYPLRIIKANPVPRLPRVKQDRLLATLYPQDLAAVAKAEGVELGYRVLWSFLAETGWRISEAVGRDEPKQDDGTDESIPPLYWRDVDFDHERVFVARTKTTETVARPLDEPTLEGLKAWRAISPKTASGDRVFVTMKGEPISVVLAAETFRAHLHLAGVTREKRPDLFPEGDEKKRRLPVRVHDVRGLFVTASLAQGRSDTWVRERTMHETPQMLDRYRRSAPHFRKYGPIVPMVEAIPELAKVAAASRGCTPDEGPSTSATTTENAERSEPSPTHAAQAGHFGSSYWGSNPYAGTDTYETSPHSAAANAAVNAAATEPVDVVEVALADAITKAAAAGRFDVVAQLGRELEERRRARSTNVVALLSARRRR